MIIVTRLNGSEIVVNADLIETVESTPDTIVTLVDGTRYVVEESPSDLIEKIQTYRAAVLRFTGDAAAAAAAPSTQSDRGHVVKLHSDEGEG